jgi:hypothetical protein
MTSYRYVVHLRLQRALELMRDGRAWLKSRLPQPSPTRAPVALGSVGSRRFADRAYGPIGKTAKIFTTRRSHLRMFRPGSAEHHSGDQHDGFC